MKVQDIGVLEGDIGDLGKEVLLPQMLKGRSGGLLGQVVVEQWEKVGIELYNQ